MQSMRVSVQLLVMTVCLLYGGYQVSSEVLAQPVSRTTVLVDAEQSPEALYPDLPPSVARATQAVVAIQRKHNQNDANGVVASGVVLNDQQVLTAAHTFEQDGRFACTNGTVITSGVVLTADYSQDAISYATSRGTDNNDISVITVEASENFKSAPDIVMAADTPAIGSTVYFINYQPAANGMIRQPGISQAASASTDYTKPAIFTGVVVGADRHGLIVATGYSRSLGLGAPDNVLRKGASGGAVVNSHGELVGLSVASDSLAADTDASRVAQQYGISLPRGNYQIAYVQSAGLHTAQQQRMTVSCQ